MRSLVIELERVDRRHERMHVAGQYLLRFAHYCFRKRRRQRMLEQVTKSLDVSARECTAKGLEICEHNALACMTELCY